MGGNYEKNVTEWDTYRNRLNINFKGKKVKYLYCGPYPGPRYAPGGGSAYCVRTYVINEYKY